MKIDDIIDLLKKNSLRITHSTMSVLEVLFDSREAYLKPEEIHQKICQSKKYKNCDQASVYRILSKLDKYGVIKKSQFQSEASRYTLKKSLGDHKVHEHYFKCNQCEHVEPFSGCLISKAEKELASKGYTQLSHHLEIRGLCPACASH